MIGVREARKNPVSAPRNKCNLSTCGTCGRGEGHSKDAWEGCTLSRARQNTLRLIRLSASRERGARWVSPQGAGRRRGRVGAADDGSTPQHCMELLDERALWAYGRLTQGAP